MKPIRHRKMASLYLHILKCVCECMCLIPWTTYCMISTCGVSYANTNSLQGPEALLMPRYESGSRPCQGVIGPWLPNPEHDGNWATMELECHNSVLNTLACQFVTYFDLQGKDILMCVCVCMCVILFFQMSSRIHWSSLSAPRSLSSVAVSEWSSLQEPGGQ